jgi:hypothetical protein
LDALADSFDSETKSLRSRRRVLGKRLEVGVAKAQNDVNFAGLLGHFNADALCHSIASDIARVQMRDSVTQFVLHTILESE